MIWVDNYWHHSVHQRLGETLHYFFLRLEPFEPSKIASELGRLLNDQKLGDIHGYKLFGRFDLLVRAWLHPNTVHSFPRRLTEIVTGCAVIRQFDVSAIDYAWYDHRQPSYDKRNDLLQNLNEDNIRALQEGDGDDLCSRLMSSGLLLRNEPLRPGAVKFFVAVELDRTQAGKEEEISQAIVRYLHEESTLFNEAVYHGHGECDILVKAQGTDFFAISRLPNWIGETFRGAHTETYFSHDPHHMLGTGKIGQLTFDEIRGRDLVAQSIVPELYDGTVVVSPDRKEEVERFLRSGARNLDIDSKLRQFIHEFALGYLQNRKTDMLKALYEFFADIEEYLRRNRREFVARVAGASAKQVYEKVGFSDREKQRFPPLGDLFQVYGEALRIKGENRCAPTGGSWNALVRLRNQTAHGAFDPGKGWAGTVRILLQHQEPLSHLFCQVFEVTGDSFPGRFF